MKSNATCIRNLAAFYDEQGKPDVAIKVNSSRSYMRRFFKADKRGGVLKVGAHEIHCRGYVAPAPVQTELDEGA
jgi:hypothetical protein